MASGDVFFRAEDLYVSSDEAVHDASPAVDVGSFHDYAVLYLGVQDGVTAVRGQRRPGLLRGLPGWFLHLVFTGSGRLLDGVAQQLRPHPVDDPAGEDPPEATLAGGDAARPVQPFPALSCPFLLASIPCLTSLFTLFAILYSGYSRYPLIWLSVVALPSFTSS